MAFDPVGTVARLGAIDRIKYDFDGSGGFDASCPPSVPVAYKMFDTPGTKVVSMQAIATNGGVANSRLNLNVTGKSLARSSQIGTVRQLSNVKNFWCGDRSSLIKLDTNFLPQFFTTEVRAVGIDVTQGVVPDPPRPGGSR